MEELQAVVAAARDDGLGVRVMGNALSVNDTAMSSEVVVRLTHLNRVLVVDATCGVVRIEAGITIARLTEVLAMHDLALPTLGSVSGQSFAGAISTGTHGTGIGYGLIATSIVELQLLLASGELVTCSRKHKTDLFLAALCSFGALGIITGAVIQCVPAFDIRATESPARLSDVLRTLPSRMRSAPLYRFWWWPHTQHVMEWRGEPVPPKATRLLLLQGGGGAAKGSAATAVAEVPPLSRWEEAWEWLRDTAFGFHALQFAMWLAMFVPLLIPLINTLWFNVVYTKRAPRLDRHDRILNFNCLFQQHVAEWALPYEQLPTALAAIESMLTATGHKVHFPVEVRFVAPDDIWLSPASNPAAAAAIAGSTSPDAASSLRGVVAYLGIIMYRPYGKPIAFKDYFAQVERIIVGLGGRTHWAKEFIAAGDASFASAYPQWAAFKRLRAELDPTGLWVNPWLARVLGIRERPQRSEKTSVGDATS